MDVDPGADGSVLPVLLKLQHIMVYCMSRLPSLLLSVRFYPERLSSA
jgi:hypothetical protein